MFELSLAGARSWLGATVAVALSSAVLVPVASAGPGYELDPVKSSIATEAEGPRGVAIDQVSQNLYVTEVTTDQATGGHGLIEQFDASGVPTANSPFVTGADDFFVGVAVNPATQGLYAYQVEFTTPQGNLGTPRMNTFSSTGVPGPFFVPSKSKAPQLAADVAGRVYLPNDSTGTVQVFSSTGALQDSIPCTGCPGGPFEEPVSVALDSAANLYVVDLADDGRVIKFKPSGGTYVYDSVLQTGSGAAAVGVDPANDDVFVGSVEDSTYHVIAYDAFGTQFDDFGGGLFAPPAFGAIGAGQIAVNATTRKVYVADSGGNAVWIFNRVASIPAPIASTTAVSSLGQQRATLNASVNPKGHGLSDCHFDYTNHADFQANGFTNATAAPCQFEPVGSSSTPTLLTATGLTPATDYDYRIVVTSNGGTAEGTAMQFKTLPPLPPSASIGTASAITQTKATLSGSVNPKGGDVSDCHFDYTNQADFQANGFANAKSTECLFTPEGTSNSPVSTITTGLTAGTTYRFRVVATTNAGTTEAAGGTFATLADTCATNPAVCPQPPVIIEEPFVEDEAQLPAIVPPVTPTTPLKCRKGFKKKKVRGKLKCVKIKKKRAKRRPI
jgi:hypothetical protein